MIWDLLIHLRKILKTTDRTFQFLSVRISKDKIDIQIGDLHIDSTLVISFDDAVHNTKTQIKATGPFKVDLIKNEFFSEGDLNQLMVYLPYPLLSFFGKKHQKCYVITHFAQTLDGRIASSSGNSKWIGNEGNLIHAHKMRALCDAILIGSKTLETDNPKLSVRLVKGEDPTKVVVGGDALELLDYIAIEKDTLLFCQNHTFSEEKYKKLKLNREGGQYNVHHILEMLHERNLYSVYIEGGAYTTSSFLKQGAIDQIQIHITPKILGSGKTGFNFKGINNIDTAIEFTSTRFIPVDDHIMFIGELY